MESTPKPKIEKDQSGPENAAVKGGRRESRARSEFGWDGQNTAEIIAARKAERFGENGAVQPQHDVELGQLAAHEIRRLTKVLEENSPGSQGYRSAARMLEDWNKKLRLIPPEARPTSYDEALETEIETVRLSGVGDRDAIQQKINELKAKQDDRSSRKIMAVAQAFGIPSDDSVFQVFRRGDIIKLMLEPEQRFEIVYGTDGGEIVLRSIDGDETYRKWKGGERYFLRASPTTVQPKVHEAPAIPVDMPFSQGPRGTAREKTAENQAQRGSKTDVLTPAQTSEMPRTDKAGKKPQEAPKQPMSLVEKLRRDASGAKNRISNDVGFMNFDLALLGDDIYKLNRFAEGVSAILRAFDKDNRTRTHKIPDAKRKLDTLFRELTQPKPESPSEKPVQTRTQEAAAREQPKPGVSEREKTLERMIQAVLRDGGFRASTFFSAEVSPDGRAGSKESHNRIQTKQNNINPLLSAARDRLEKNGIDESVVFEEDTMPLTEQVSIPAKKNWLGRITEPALTETRWTGKSRVLMHAETVQNGLNEPSVTVRYAVQMSDPIHNQWRDYSGRGGQYIFMDISLPKSVATELQKAIQEDPKLIRQIVEKVMKERILGPGKEEAWIKPLGPKADSMRPPYERMGRRIYIQPMEEKPGNFTWHEEYLHPV
jgi:hypothetical protein